MKDRIRTLFANESFREKSLYLVVGGLTTLVNTVVHFLFIKLVSSACSIPENTVWLNEAATAVSWVVAVTFAFYPNKKYVFKSTDTSKKQLLREISGFATARLLSLGVEAGLMPLFMSVFGFHYMVSKVITQVIVIIMNYFASKFWIFKKR